MRRTIAALWLLAVILSSALPARSAAPTRINVKTSAGMPAAMLPPQWQSALSGYFSSNAPDFLTVKSIPVVLGQFDAHAPRVQKQLEPVIAQLQQAAQELLGTPIPPGATEADLQASSNKFRFLNDPSIRNYLTHEQQARVGAAAWAYNNHLWDKTGMDLSAKIAGIAKALESSALTAAKEDSPSLPAGPGPEVELKAVSGDIAQVKADALVAVVDCAGVCHGGINAVLEKVGGPSFRAQVEAAKPLKDGQVFLAKADASKKGKLKNVVLVVDDRVQPLHKVVLAGLETAEKEGLTSVTLPALRTGYVFGAVEKTYEEIVAETMKGIDYFMAQGRRTLKKITLVVQNNSRLVASFQEAWDKRAAAKAFERERSLRTDLREAKLSGKGIALTPDAADIVKSDSPVYETLLKPWDLKYLGRSHVPVRIGSIADRKAFSSPTPSVLNMPIKMQGTDVRVPVELAQFQEFLQKIIDHEKAANPRFDDFYAYLTVDQYPVKKGLTHRKPGVHIDGVQGARYAVKLPPEHLYSASDALGTVFYDQTFDLSKLDPAKQHVHAELERQAKEENAIRAKDYEIYFWDSYSVHRADVADKDLFRTFIRVEFSMKKYDAQGDTVSPLFDYDWERVARPIPAGLDDSPAGAPRPGPTGEKDPQGYRVELSDIEPGAEHTVHDLGAYLRDNLGAGTVRAAKNGKAAFLITVGEGQEALARAKALGWELGERMTKKEGYHQVYKARSPEGKPGYVIARVNGDDRVLHIQSLLKLAGAPGDRVTTIGKTKSWREHYKQVFSKVGHVPDLVVYGFSNTTIDALLLRNGFKNGRHFATLRRNYKKKLAAIGGGERDAADLDGMSMQVLELADGRKVWFLHCMFGDLARDLVGAAVDHGAKNVAFIGSAGSLEEKALMGEVVIPAAYRKADGSQVPLDYLPAISGVERRGTYRRVPTPNVGTKKWTKKAKASGVDLIESELGYLLDELKLRPEVRLQVALVIAEATFGPDGRDMTQWGLADLRKLIPALGKVLDAALGARTEDYIVKSYSSVPLR